jgi:hypothetical protein
MAWNFACSHCLIYSILADQREEVDKLVLALAKAINETPPVDTEGRVTDDSFLDRITVGLMLEKRYTLQKRRQTTLRRVP